MAMVAPVIKILVLAASVLFGWLSGKHVSREKDDTAAEPPRETLTEQLSRTLDLCFAIALCGAVAWALGALRIKPLESRGYEAFSEFLISLSVLGLKAVLFVLLPAFFLYRLLRSFEGLTLRLVVYGILAGLGAMAWHADQKRRAVEAVAQARALEATRETERQAQRETLTMEQARQNAARKEKEEHERTVEQLVELTMQVYVKWNQDLLAARAIGLEGERPPMLAIVDEGSDVVKVTNHFPGNACVKLVRALRLPDSQEYLRCALDTERDCAIIRRGQSMSFSLLRHAGNDACRRGTVEYRVGTPLKPEPSWWSMSALEDGTERAADFRDRYVRMTTIDLINERAKLEKLLIEPDRAARWARELGSER
jgi:hypothetical protein